MITIKSGLRGRQILRCLSSPAQTVPDYSHAVIGAGVVGLAVSAELSKVPGNRVLLIEKNSDFGMETSSRNSEVIHAGLYYPVNSLKTRLCLEGSQIIYNELDSYKTGVEWSKCGKWVVAQTDADDSYLETMYLKAKQELGLPVEMLPSNKTQWVEPAITVRRSVLNSPTSGIIDSHSLMTYLSTVFDNNDGDLAVGSKVVDLEYQDKKGYLLSCQDTVNESQDTASILVENIVNTAGLHAHHIANMLLPADRQVKQFYAKGNYYYLKGSGFPPVRRLVYPVPPRNGKSLGTHLTIDLQGSIRFGPDLNYVDNLDDYTVNSANIPRAYEAITTYYPHIQPSDLQPAYSGIRPKLAGPHDRSFKDFYIKEEPGFPGFVNLLGIESPGLTASIAIGRYVKLLYHGSR
ncbi:LAMI_0E02740g1_1 [Lachancea mirantina]|uniref:L-2-hydroxyglutarate dehydrogenase, mitochondrial n=1 Tax=Lachancea mirantina TaxID=1230905 RepID=A0A1G4JJJ2_9SACH|nr:LAMI_0E02740g1_1 [Lachancea mirantina]